MKVSGPQKSWSVKPTRVSGWQKFDTKQNMTSCEGRRYEGAGVGEKHGQGCFEELKQAAAAPRMVT